VGDTEWIVCDYPIVSHALVSLPIKLAQHIINGSAERTRSWKGDGASRWKWVHTDGECRAIDWRGDAVGWRVWTSTGEGDLGSELTALDGSPIRPPLRSRHSKGGCNDQSS